MSLDRFRTIPALEVLGNYDVVSLQQMGRLHSVDISNKGKGKIAAELAKNLYSANRIHNAWKDAEETERAVLHRLILNGGLITTQVLRQQLEEDGIVEERVVDRYGGMAEVQGSAVKRNSRIFEHIIARLTALGLVFTATPGPYSTKTESRRPGVILFIPDPILRHLPKVTVTVKTAAAPSTVRPAEPDTFLKDQFVLVSMAREEPLGLISSGLLAKRAMVRLDGALRRPEGANAARSELDLARLPLLRTLTEAVGLLTAGATGLRLGDEAAAFFARPRGLRRKLLFDAYLATTRWSELPRLPDLSITPRTNLNVPAVATARRRVLAELAELPGGEWFTIDHLVNRLHTKAYEFLLSRTVSHAYNTYYYFSSPYRSDVYAGYNALGLTFTHSDRRDVEWKDVEGQFIRLIVTGALHDMGIVDLGAEDESAPPSHFRITPLGATLLKGDTPDEPDLPTNVVIQPNFQVLAFEPADEATLFSLDAMAKRVRIEQVAEYHLTRESVLAAEKSGIEIAAILSFLERISRNPLPQNVRRSLEDWGAQMERIKVLQNVAMVHAVDEGTLDLLYADSEMAPLLGRRLTPTAALVPAEHLQAVHSRMMDARAGLPLPALTEGNDTDLPGGITVAPDGTVTFSAPLPSMYVRHAVSSLADEVEPDVFRITRASLQRAVRSGKGGRPGMDAGRILITLERLSKGPLPPEMVQSVHRWARDWGSAGLADVTLLRVDTPQIMADLLADDDLKDDLRPLPGSPTHAIVRCGAADRVRAALEERGVDLNSTL